MLKRKKGSRSWHSWKLDNLVKQLVKDRDGNKCQWCGDYVTGSNCHGSHVVPVSAGLALRWDLDNIKCLSYHYHINVWHKRPLEASEWFEATFPDRFKHLNEHRNDKWKPTSTQLEDFYNEVKGMTDWKEYMKAYDKFRY